ncbi:putative ABC transporter [Eremomyces bilateralis CBS 781.70]|uniref:ABC transporter n=1 Tax=Eremomyces bilateralis CBS 781.70 TaxID=1392243 RepID=A0A6G1G7S0_9PEZI|nr:putative ABC transporter [Eremomyces bilateralis CBS 781.70]KAF1814145.1 putative ABC transporter [Eremomyces bilateralis CBS 781.70]
MAFLRQLLTLVRKDLLLGVNRRSLHTTILRAFLAPLIFSFFITFVIRAFWPQQTYGIGSPRPIRSLADAMTIAVPERPTLMFVNEVSPDGDIDRVINEVAGPVRERGHRVVLTRDGNELLNSCRSTLRGVTKCYGAAVFHSSPTEGPDGRWNYTLRFDGEFGRSIDVSRDDNAAQVFHLPLQHAIDSAIAGIDANAAELPNNAQQLLFTSLTPEEYRNLITKKLLEAVTNFLGAVWYLAFIGVCYHLVGTMSKEREMGMADLLESMMPNIRRWEPQVARLVARHLAFDIMYAPSWIVIGIVMKTGLFRNTSAGIVIIFSIIAGLSLVSWSILGAAFFKRAQLSGITTVILTLVLAVAGQVTSKYMSVAAVGVLSALFSPIAFTLAMINMARFDHANRGTNLTEGAPDAHWDFPSIAFWVFLIVQTFAYIVLAAFVERALYGSAATRKGRNVNWRPTQPSSDAGAQVNVPVRLENFSKIYQSPWWARTLMPFLGLKSSPVTAVKNLSLSALKGQILVLVGANGCGKSTTLNSIAGLLSLTSGSITLDGTGGIGLCPQKNVLWNGLTVEQHARIFVGLKRSGKMDRKQEIQELIDSCGLSDKRKAMVRTLSGGQKRKLQLICMLAGGSQVCCVDEVSGGLDPLSRRKVWEILLKERGQRTTILTTHFLDEAEFLADHMVVMGEGRLKGAGSTGDLKRRVGGGYRVHVLPMATYEDEKGMHVTEKYDHDETHFVSSTAEAVSKMKELEAEGKRNVQITGPTMEDVFLRLAGEEIDSSSEHELEHEAELSIMGTPSTGTPKETPSKVAQDLMRARTRESQAGQADLLTGTRIGTLKQMRILFLKRWTVFKRNYVPHLAAFALPIIAAGFMLLLLRDLHNPGCDPVSQVNDADIETLSDSIRPQILFGPASALRGNSISLIQGILPSQTLGSGDTAINANNQSSLMSAVHLVPTVDEFYTFVDINQSTIIPGGIFLGDLTTPPTLAIRSNMGVLAVYSAVFLHNALNVLLSNVTISTQFAVFDLPWPADTGNALQFVFYFGLVMAAYPALFALYPNIERTRNVRALEYSNGVRPLPLWGAYLAFDSFVNLVVAGIATAILTAGASDAWWQAAYLFLVFFLYGIASTLLAYFISQFSKSQLSAFAFAAGSQAVMLLLYLTAYFIITSNASGYTADSSILITHFTFGLITPVGQLARALLVSLNVFSILCSGSPPVKAEYGGGILHYGGPILYLIGQSLVLFLLLVWSDSGFTLGFLERKWPFKRSDRSRHGTSDLEDRTTEEPEVIAEAARVPVSDDGLKALGLSKTYSGVAFGKLVAVTNVTFGVREDEVFALVGPNGAGKSTTISMLRGEVKPNSGSGDVLVDGVSVLSDRQVARANLGVCPQFDALDKMTVLEHLRFFAAIRGVSDVDRNVEGVIHSVGLTPFRDRLAHKLSGGNKRKLSLGIALIGNPAVVLLDEPSSGMDPLAKRSMWRTLGRVANGRAILLTTHSMEEADALSNRVGVLAKRLLDIGDTEHLRRKYGHGFHVQLCLKSAPHSSEEEMESVEKWVKERFGESVEREGRHWQGLMRFHVPSRAVHLGLEGNKDEQNKPEEGASVSKLFVELEEHKETLGLEFYSVSPTTFDEIFLKVVAKHHVGEEDSIEKTSRWRKFLC